LISLEELGREEMMKKIEAYRAEKEIHRLGIYPFPFPSRSMLIESCAEAKPSAYHGCLRMTGIRQSV
jgi:hypothetical protein